MDRFNPNLVNEESWNGDSWRNFRGGVTLKKKNIIANEVFILATIMMDLSLLLKVCNRKT